jgi:hypothetical protein
MKRALFLTFVLVVLTSCVQVLDVEPLSTYTLNEIKTASVGSPFFVAQTGTLKRYKHWVGVLNSPDGWQISEEKSPDYMRKELIYSGVSGGVLEVAYREYRGGLAAPAFFQNLKYDLSSSKIVRFQNFEFEILRADNNSITYQVLKDS